MTVVVGVKVFDGIVIAADSATTIPLPGGSHQVYNNANKIFHLHRRFPISAATWGLGVIGPSSISTLAKDLRRRFMGADPDKIDWKLEEDYTVKGVVERLIEMMFDELYAPQVNSGNLPPVSLGFLVGGYEGKGSKSLSEMWTVTFEGVGNRPVPQLMAASDQVGWQVFAIEEAAKRLFHGIDPSLKSAILAATDPTTHAAIEQAVAAQMRQPVLAGMPFTDAIKLAEFIAQVTTGYAHFLPGPDVVGGPIEVASISRDEGFKWINRKHYYPATLNPEAPNHDV